MDELVERLRAAAKEWRKKNKVVGVGETRYDVALEEAADAIEELQKSVLRLEEASGILDELPMVDQRTPCDTCAHKGNVDFDYCHICNNEADMYKPKPPKEESNGV